MNPSQTPQETHKKVFWQVCPRFFNTSSFIGSFSLFQWVLKFKLTSLMVRFNISLIAGNRQLLLSIGEIKYVLMFCNSPHIYLQIDSVLWKRKITVISYYYYNNYSFHTHTKLKTYMVITRGHSGSRHPSEISLSSSFLEPSPHLSNLTDNNHQSTLKSCSPQN